LFNPYVLPPPDKQVDEQGKPIEMLPCDTCSGIGYIGRIAIFEILDGNDRLRKTLLNQPSLDAINQVAQKTGGQLLVSNGYKLALLGITSVSEAQRALKS
jgi:type IV pilus assembly protein PilB